MKNIYIIGQKKKKKKKNTFSKSQGLIQQL